MLYSEFVEHTGCKDSSYNYKVYRNLETMYMNSDVDKETVYEYGRKLVDNTPSPEQIEMRNSIYKTIEDYKESIKWESDKIEQYEKYLDDDDSDYWQSQINCCRDNIRNYKSRIKELRWVLG